MNWWWGNGPKLKESEIGADPPPPPPPTGQPFKIEEDRNGIPQLPAGRPGMLIGAGVGGRNTITARQQLVSQLANFLENTLGKPVVDKTGLTAKYDYGFAFDATGLAGEFKPSAAAATFPPRRLMTVEMIVVERVKRVPTRISSRSELSRRDRRAQRRD